MGNMGFRNLNTTYYIRLLTQKPFVLNFKASTWSLWLTVLCRKCYNKSSRTQAWTGKPMTSSAKRYYWNRRWIVGEYRTTWRSSKIIFFSLMLVINVSNMLDVIWKFQETLSSSSKERKRRTLHVNEKWNYVLGMNVNQALYAQLRT